jgi:hypothetical protein
MREAGCQRSPFPFPASGHPHDAEAVRCFDAFELQRVESVFVARPIGILTTQQCAHYNANRTVKLEAVRQRSQAERKVLAHSGRFPEMTMLKDRRERPCPNCRTVVQFDVNEYRLDVPCPKCGAKVGVTHGSYDTRYLEGTSHEPVIATGRHAGFMTTEEWTETFERNATESIRRWEDAVRSKSPLDVCREAKDKAFQAVSNLGVGKRWFDINGNRYTLIRKRRDIRVEPIPPKRTRERGG